MAFSRHFSSASPILPGRSWSGHWRKGITLLAALASLLGTQVAFAEEDTDSPGLTAQDNELLDDVQRRAVLYFTEHSDFATGLTLDRAPNNGVTSNSPASIAATVSPAPETSRTFTG